MWPQIFTSIKIIWIWTLLAIFLLRTREPELSTSTRHTLPDHVIREPELFSPYSARSRETEIPSYPQTLLVVLCQIMWTQEPENPSYLLVILCPITWTRDPEIPSYPQTLLLYSARSRELENRDPELSIKSTHQNLSDHVNPRTRVIHNLHIMPDHGNSKDIHQIADEILRIPRVLGNTAWAVILQTL